MKKFLLTLGTGILAVSLLAACGPTEPAEDTEEEIEAPADEEAIDEPTEGEEEEPVEGEDADADAEEEAEEPAEGEEEEEEQQS